MMDSKVADPTVKVVEFDTVPSVAVIVDPPANKALAKPELLMVATLGIAEFQVATLVMS